MYDDVAPTVHVYAPEGKDVAAHLDRIKGYNSRADKPTAWTETVYLGSDFFEKMIAERNGNVVVLSGNNRKKTDYIAASLQHGFNVLADKPMVIEAADFEKLKAAFDTAAKNKLLLYDIMTERFEITTILQRELSQDPSVFGNLEKGSEANPAVTKESVHHFYKYVSGNVVVRPTWFLDVAQQGEGVVDVSTHLVDLVQWAAFPEQILDYKKDIQINSARHWATDMPLSDFKTITKTDAFPDFLKKNVVKDSILQVFSNGEINYTLRGVHAKTSVIWKYKAADGAGDSHYSMMRGTKANLEIKQGAEEKYKATLYIEPRRDAMHRVSTTTPNKDAAFGDILKEAFKKIAQKYDGVSFEPDGKRWRVVIPEKYNATHEAHFGVVTTKFLGYLKSGNLPAWEVPNMLAKYYTTTQALSLARRK